MARIGILRRIETLERQALFPADGPASRQARRMAEAFQADSVLVEIRATIGQHKADEKLSEWMNSPEKREAAKRIALRLADMQHVYERESTDG